MTVHREHKVKRGKQHESTSSMFIIKLSISTCFGHHYSHHQDNKTVSYCVRCSELGVQAVVGCGLVGLGRELCALCDSYSSSL